MKSEIREIMKAMRKAMDKADVFEKSRNAEKIFLDSPIYQNAKTVMLYMPLGNETDTLNILSNAHFDKKTVVVPVTDSETFEITAHEITEDTEFKKGVFSLCEPKEKKPFDSSKIDVVLVPGVSFSRGGKRIGFGKGCYDKFLKGLDAIKIGFCYDFQIADDFETDEFDVEMDFLITESELINCKMEQ